MRFNPHIPSVPIHTYFLNQETRKVGNGALGFLRMLKLARLPLSFTLPL